MGLHAEESADVDQTEGDRYPAAARRERGLMESRCWSTSDVNGET